MIKDDRKKLTNAERRENLWTLYDSVLKHLLTTLSNPEVEPTASMMNTTITFLKANGIKADECSRPSQVAQELEKLYELPFDSNGSLEKLRTQ